MTTNENTGLNNLFNRMLTVGGIACIVGLIALVVLGFLNGFADVWRGYLTAYIFWWGLAMGCLAVLMIHHLSGGRWGFIMRRPLEAGAMVLVVMALAFVPIIVAVMTGNASLYEWLDAKKIAEDPLITYKVTTTGYLLPLNWTIRAVVVFALWIGLAYLLYSTSRAQDTAPDGNFTLANRMRTISGIGIPVYIVTMTMVGVDWYMSIDPHWFSAIYGVLFIVGQGLTTFACIIILLSMLTNHYPFSKVVDKNRLDEYGKLMLAFVVLWAYVNYGQYVIIWSGNIPEFTPWFVRRFAPGWQAITVILVLFHFALPFALLLSRLLKRNLRMLAAVAGLILLMRMLENFWIVAPEYTGIEFYGSSIVGMLVTYLAAFAFLGGLWCMGFAWFVRQQPVLPENDLRNDPRAMKGQVAHA
ncbi:MAG: hypothetical protein HC876_02580 [Chloroflexaceae bacterium]|nr:hypothetical protein [Chloroflexaceae bacterium]NJO04495.1 hypothetical protein [Chloroflexaceae bacterium]